jgi:hypothetical protein
VESLGITIKAAGSIYAGVVKRLNPPARLLYYQQQTLFL